MRFSFTVALIALALGVTSMALPMNAPSELAERDEPFDLETRMFDIEDLEARDYEVDEGGLMARGTPDELVARDAPPINNIRHLFGFLSGVINPKNAS